MNVLYPGSFNPFTLGHLNIAKRAACLFDKVVVAVATDTNKSCVSVEQRIRFATESLKGIANIEIVEYSGLTTECAGENNCKAIIRGIRNSIDFEYEKNLSMVYKSLTDIEMVFLLSEQTAHISSSTVRELIKCGANKLDLINYVSPKIIDEVICIYK